MHKSDLLRTGGRGTKAKIYKKTGSREGAAVDSDGILLLTRLEQAGEYGETPVVNPQMLSEPLLLSNSIRVFAYLLL